MFARKHYLYREANNFRERKANSRPLLLLSFKYIYFFFRNTSSLKIDFNIPQFTWGEYMTRLDQSRANENIWRIIKDRLKKVVSFLPGDFC